MNLWEPRFDPPVPPLQTDRGRLRFFTVSETRLDATDAGVPVIDSLKQTFAVQNDGGVRLAREGEVTKFLGEMLHVGTTGD